MTPMTSSPAPRANGGVNLTRACRAVACAGVASIPARPVPTRLSQASDGGNAVVQRAVGFVAEGRTIDLLPRVVVAHFEVTRPRADVYRHLIL
jgi:hypothetical protein